MKTYASLISAICFWTKNGFLTSCVCAEVHRSRSHCWSKLCVLLCFRAEI